MNTVNPSVKQELNDKFGKLLQLIEDNSLDAVLLDRVSSFAWATGGADSHVNTALTEGIASLLITREKRFLITNTIEAPRLDREENLKTQGWEFQVTPWYDDGEIISKLTNGMRLGADHTRPGALDLSRDLARLRSQLNPGEIQRFRTLGKECASAMQEAVDAAQPGMTEFQLAGLLAQACENRGIQAIVNLIGTDERIFSFRHPLPTQKKLEKYAMFVLCGRKWGLVCSLTRLLHFGSLPDDLRLRAEIVSRVDAEMIHRTRPGSTLGQVFDRALKAYAIAGYADEWQRHHQGGLVGYEPREITVVPNMTMPVRIGQAYAWNPSIAGAKSEDTFIVGDQENEILTTISDWPSMHVELDGKGINRPAILVKK